MNNLKKKQLAISGITAFFLFVAITQISLDVNVASANNNPTLHNHLDNIPNFCANPNITSLKSGNWSDPSTWSLNRVPNNSDNVGIEIGHTVTLDTTVAISDCVGVRGTLSFKTDINTKLAVANTIVYDTGHLVIGTSANPIQAQFTAEIVIKSKPLNTSTDPDQFGISLITFGRVTIHGATKTPSFLRTSVEPRAGNTTITLEQSPSGWKIGDRIFLPDTRQVSIDNWFNPNYALQVEERTISNISGNIITLSSPLSYDHRGAKDANGSPTVLSNGIKLLPHVGNLTRNVVIRSENPSGTRGHTMYTNRADVDIRYAQFQDLGRTTPLGLDASSNHIGRYPVHFHHLWGPTNPSNTGYQYEFIGNAVNDSRKWPIAIHGTHFGHIYQNVIFGGNQLTGSGIALEDGTETENRIEENFVANIRGDVNARNTGPSTEPGSTPGSGAECYWAAGFNNRFINNVASTCRNVSQQIVAGPGFKFIVPAGTYTARNPLYRGADMTSTSQTFSVIPQMQPIKEFRGNEVYGGSADGLTIWDLGSDAGYNLSSSMGETIIKDFRVWHTYEGAVWLYPTTHVTIDGLVWRIDPTASPYWQAAVQGGDYRQTDLTIRGGDIHAGAVLGGTSALLRNVIIENVRATTHDHAFQFQTPYTPGTQAGQPDPPGVSAVLRNNIISAWPGQSLRTISTDFRTGASAYPNSRYEIFAYDYQGQAGNNFRVYWNEQANQNVHGGLAPCTNTTAHPEIDGITCSMTGSPLPPPPPSPSPSPTPTPVPTPVPTPIPTPPPTPGTINISPSTITFTGVVGGLRPSSINVSVNTSNGSSWASQDTCSFFDANPTSGSSGGSHTLTPSSGWDALTAGTYTC
ncbi:MAG: G8 domain-containing protein, partial [Minisyncoccia bacterium]